MTREAALKAWDTRRQNGWRHPNAVEEAEPATKPKLAGSVTRPPVKHKKKRKKTPPQVFKTPDHQRGKRG